MLGPPAQPSFEALKQAAGRSLGVLRAPECLANMASQNPRAPAAAEMLLRSKPLRNSEQIQADRGRVIWPLKANGCQEIVLNLPERWHPALSPASG